MYLFCLFLCFILLYLFSWSMVLSWKALWSALLLTHAVEIKLTLTSGSTRGSVSCLRMLWHMDRWRWGLIHLPTGWWLALPPLLDDLLHQWINYLRLQYKLGQLSDLSSFCMSDICDFFDSQSIRLSPTARQSAGKANVPTIHFRKQPLQSLVS